MSSTVDQTPELQKDSDAFSPLESPRFSCLLDELASPIKTITFCPEVSSIDPSEGEIHHQLQNIYLQLKQRHRRTNTAPNISLGKRYTPNTPNRRCFESPLKPNCIADSKALILKSEESQQKLMECVNKRKTAFIIDEIQKRTKNRSICAPYSPAKPQLLEEKLIQKAECKPIPIYYSPLTPESKLTYETRKTLGVSNTLNQIPKTSNASTQVDFQAYLTENEFKPNETFGTPSKKPSHTRTSSNVSNYMQESSAVRYTLSNITSQVTAKLKPDELCCLLNSESSKVSVNSCIVSSSKLSHLNLQEKKITPNCMKITSNQQNPIVFCSTYKSLSPYKKRMGFSSGFDIENFIKRAKPLE